MDKMEKAVRYYEKMRASQKKYLQSEKGQMKIAEIKTRKNDKNVDTTK